MKSKKVKYSLTAYLNISSYNYRNKDYYNECIKTVENLVDSSDKLFIPFDEYGEFTFKISYISKEEASKERLLKSIENESIVYIRNPAKLLESDLLKIRIDEINVPYEIPEGVRNMWNEFDSNLLEIIDEGQQIETLEFNRAMIYEIFIKRIHDLIFAANLSNFGSITVNEYVVFQDSNVYAIGGKQMDYSILFEAKQNSMTWKYPKLSEIDIVDVWKWLTKREDFLQGFSHSAVTRAIINLLEISNSDSNMKLFRAVMGIEGLYTKGKNNLLEQVREKTQILLGPQEEFKKLYSNMYDFRSKFIHGELNFPATVSIDFSKKLEQHSEDLKKATCFAILLLGASIQQLILRDWDGVKFDYMVSNHKE